MAIRTAARVLWVCCIGKNEERLIDPGPKPESEPEALERSRRPFRAAVLCETHSVTLPVASPLGLPQASQHCRRGSAECEQDAPGPARRPGDPRSRLDAVEEGARHVGLQPGVKDSLELHQADVPRSF